LVRVENDTSRLRPLITVKADRQFGIIGQRGANPDDHRIMLGTKAMALLARLAPRNPAAFARGGCDPTIQGGGKF
jgi:hypothetical protein